VRAHSTQYLLDEIADVLEGARLLAIAVNCQRFVLSALSSVIGVTIDAVSVTTETVGGDHRECQNDCRDCQNDHRDCQGLPYTVGRGVIVETGTTIETVGDDDSDRRDCQNDHRDCRA
jgi:hypothetical protein